MLRSLVGSEMCIRDRAQDKQAEEEHESVGAHHHRTTVTAVTHTRSPSLFHVDQRSSLSKFEQEASKVECTVVASKSRLKSGASTVFAPPIPLCGHQLIPPHRNTFVAHNHLHINVRQAFTPMTPIKYKPLSSLFRKTY
eukprot:TRINITY_DN5222_c0_g2_i1.p2 TRINITY_DN5222_c0_g2~~TRINITY_DN5222_c0_g2_i1.p2  ORF type:complete len:139 (-),score=16.32 TRINITY_DN5222_c0_g2_i1:11-427(-)